ncbi:hypothetical protein QTP70_030325 [Hemibagrus guttatus]|uniref:Uncharacterized protein n=1 Tax=Hemibagrus guttatus TaxID=175788 RepID=A0AAE0QC67_9TELE|nr:hypothetical protein QTP70_030325 [Hemibagrus guttatus]
MGMVCFLPGRLLISDSPLLSHKAEYLLSFSLSILTLLARLYPDMGSLTTAMLMTLNLSSSSDTTASARISECLSDISSWMMASSAKTQSQQN